MILNTEMEQEFRDAAVTAMVTMRAVAENIDDPEVRDSLADGCTLSADQLQRLIEKFDGVSGMD
jgi:ribonuclease I